MKEYTLVTKQKTEGDIGFIAVFLYEGAKPRNVSSDYLNALVKWLVTIDWLTKQVQLKEYRRQNGVERVEKEIKYQEIAFVGWELLDQSIAIPSALKHRIAEELEVYY